MAQQNVMQSRERFRKALEEAASKQAIPIQKLSIRDVPNRGAAELFVQSGGKERVFTVTDSALSGDPQGEIDQILNVLIDNE